MGISLCLRGQLNMAWTTSDTFTDAPTGVVIEKQHQKKPNRGNQTRYLVRILPNKYFVANRTQIFDLTDALNELCADLEDGKF